LALSVLHCFLRAACDSLVFPTIQECFSPKENPQLQALEALERTYTKVENVLFILAPKSGNIFEKETLEAIEFLTEQSWLLPYSSRVDSLSNYQHTRAFEDDLMVADLVTDSHSLSDKEIANIKAIALSQPMLLSSMIDKKGVLLQSISTLLNRMTAAIKFTP